MQQTLRRKSCQACARSKRRCDLTTPRCRRCQGRGKECVYPRLPPEPIGEISDTATDMSALPLATSLTSYSAMQDNLGSVTSDDAIWAVPELDFQTLQSGAFSPMQTVPKPLSPVMLSLLQDIMAQPGMPPPPVSLESSPSEPGSLLSLSSGSTSSGTTSISSAARSPIPYSSRSIFIPRTEYAARRMAAQATALASEGQTPFIHHSQVISSAALRDAISASALHAMRNPANSFIVRSEISRRVTLLVDTVETARGHSHQPDLDMLHPVQALIIYQCIRLFSTSDISQQAQAERDGAHLRIWLDRLRKQLDSSVPPLSAQSQVQNWESWVWFESVRRTIVFAELLGGIYSFLKFGWDDAHGRMDMLEFSAHAGLWEARSAAEWRAVQATSSPLHVRIMTFNTDICRAKPCDVDDLVVAIIAINSGLESLEEWLAGDAVAIKKWGLRADTHSRVAY